MRKESHIASGMEAGGGELNESFKDVQLDEGGEKVKPSEGVSDGAQIEKPTDEIIDAQKEEVAENIEPIPDLKELYESSSIENPEAVFDIETALKDVSENLETVNARIAEIRQRIADRERLGEVRGELELDTTSEAPAEDEKVLSELLEKQEELQEVKEETESLQELQGLMDEMNALKKENAPAILYIIQNGTTPDGRPLKTKSGKEIKPEVAKDIASAVEKGVTKLTKAIVKTVLLAVKGVIKGVFAGIKAAME